MKKVVVGGLMIVGLILAVIFGVAPLKKKDLIEMEPEDEDSEMDESLFEEE